MFLNWSLDMNDAALAGALVGIGTAILFMKLRAIDRRLNRLSRLDAKVDALLKASGVKFDELQDLPADVREALERGETILAIKRFRQATGTGLKEAKDFVDEVRRRGLSAS
jgi:hypothetical protein